MAERINREGVNPDDWVEIDEETLLDGGYSFSEMLRDTRTTN